MVGPCSAFGSIESRRRRAGSFVDELSSIPLAGLRADSVEEPSFASRRKDAAWLSPWKRPPPGVSVSGAFNPPVPSP
jgi:hypothetical protein